MSEPCPASAAISWYRTPLPPGESKRLHAKSDVLGARQTLGFLACFALTAGLSLHSFARWPWFVTVLLVFAHGTVSSFLINGVHELTHGTVFATRALNSGFARVLAFLGWINHERFVVSHARHHRYTLHQPDDLEVVLPLRVLRRQFFTTGIDNLPSIWMALREQTRLARGRFGGEWELTLFPPSAPQKQTPTVRWARVLLGGHAIILAMSLWAGWWLVPVLFSLNQCYGGWLFFLCNHTQHIGLQDGVPDFRLSCRTFTVNPLVGFLYWHMNFHIEHHMFAAVPCYRLARLHQLIRHDLAPCPDGLAATWREIADIQRLQDADPSYQHVAPLPAVAASTMKVKTAPADANGAAAGGKVLEVRQEGTELDLDLEGGSTVQIKMAEASLLPPPAAIHPPVDIYREDRCTLRCKPGPERHGGQ